MPRVIEKTSCRIPLEGGAIFRYSYMPTWKLDYVLNGERLRVTLSADKRESLRMASELLEEKNRIERGNQARPAADITLREVADTYLLMRRSKLPPAFRSAPRDYHAFRVDEDRLNMILSRLPVTIVADLRKAMCRKFIDQLMTEKCRTKSKKKVSRSTANKPVRLLMSALRHGASIDLCGDPLAGLVLQEPEQWEIRKSRRAMSAEEYGRFVGVSVARDEKLSKDNPDRLPQTPIFMAIYEAGRRREEIMLIEWPAVHLDGEFPTWEFWDTKGSKLTKSSREPERYAIPPRLVKYLTALKALHERKQDRKVGAGDRVFLSANGFSLNGENLLDDFYLILEEAEIPKADHRGRTLDIHAARTTVYAWGADAGIPVDQMMTFVGHKDIRTAMKHYRDPNCVKTQAIAAKLAAVMDTKIKPKE